MKCIAHKVLFTIHDTKFKKNTLELWCLQQRLSCCSSGLHSIVWTSPLKVTVLRWGGTTCPTIVCWWSDDTRFSWLDFRLLVRRETIVDDNWPPAFAVLSNFCLKEFLWGFWLISCIWIVLSWARCIFLSNWDAIGMLPWLQPSCDWSLAFDGLLGLWCDALGDRWRCGGKRFAWKDGSGILRGKVFIPPGLKCRDLLWSMLA